MPDRDRIGGIAGTGHAAGSRSGAGSGTGIKAGAGTERVRRRVTFRRKMNLLVALPVAATLLFAIPLTVGQIRNATAWTATAAYLQSTEPVSLLVEDLSIERESSLTALSGGHAAHADFLASVEATDAQATVAAWAFGIHQPPAFAAAIAAVRELSYVRKLTVDPNLQLPTSKALLAHTQELVNADYGAVVNQLVGAIGLRDRVAAGGPAAALENILAALYQTDVSENQREAALVAFSTTVNGADAVHDFATAQQMGAVAADEAEDFLRYATPADARTFTQTTTLPEVGRIAAYQEKIAATLAVDLNALRSQADTVTVGDQLTELRSVSAANDLTADFVTLSAVRAAKEKAVTAGIIATAKQNARRTLWTTVGLIGLAVIVFGALLSLTVVIRRSVVHALAQLTRAATKVARAAAVDLERVADEDAGQQVPMPEFEPLPVTTRDEIGALAEAFNHVQETALLVLERQLTIRRNTAEMFGNVGHRIHNLTGRQLALIDELERSEADPELLDRLYRIDHLAVRLQRGADSLILLSGERESNVSGLPMRLTDVVRSAVGRVEGYQRAVLIAEDDAMVVPAAISDLTLMVAELVENAVSFSPASSRVEIAVALTQRGFVVEIVDRGLGMTGEQLVRENARLVRRDRLDLTPTRVLGLFVVGRLAQRTGASVELAMTLGGGTTARIYVPGFLLAGPPRKPLPHRTPPAERVLEASPDGVLRHTSPVPEITATQNAFMPLPEPRRETEPTWRPPAPTGPAPASSYAKLTFVPLDLPPTPPPVAPARQPPPDVGFPEAAGHPASPALIPTMGRRARTVQPAPAPPASAPPASAPPAPAPPASAPPAPAPPAADGVPPLPATPTADLPQRVRTAFRQPQWPPADVPTAAPAPTIDPVAVRDTLEEYEAGVEQALRESADDLPTRRRSQARHAGAVVPAGDDGDEHERRTNP